TSHVVVSDHLTASGLTVGRVSGSNFASRCLATDYALSSATANSAGASASISAKVVTATLTNSGVTKVYDGSTTSSATPTYTVATPLGTDVVNVRSEGRRVGTSHVVGSDHRIASGLTVGSVSGSTCASPSLASDCALSAATANSAGASASISAKVVTATLTNSGVTKVYDGSTTSSATPTYTVATPLGTDVVNV